MTPIADIVSQHNTRGGTKTYAQLAALYGYSSIAAVRSAIRRYEGTHGSKSAMSEELRLLTAVNKELRRQLEQVEAQRVSMYDASARDDTDWQEWLTHVKRFKSLRREVRALIVVDSHFPDEDARALDLVMQINRQLDPDVIIFAGDMFDFDVLSTHWPRMYHRKRVDPFEEVRGRWDTLTRQLKADATNAVIVATGDNHGQGRMEAYINERAVEFGDRLTEDYNDLVRSQNRVLWLGWVQEVRIGSLLVEHGKKAGANAARDGLKARGWATPRAQGHGHRKQGFINVIEFTEDDGTSTGRYPVESIMVGCTCNVNPHYTQDTKATDWNQGAAVAHINMHGTDVHFTNILFHPRRDGTLTCVFGANVLTAPHKAQRLEKSA